MFSVVPTTVVLTVYCTIVTVMTEVDSCVLVQVAVGLFTVWLYYISVLLFCNLTISQFLNSFYFLTFLFCIILLNICNIVLCKIYLLPTYKPINFIICIVKVL